MKNKIPSHNKKSNSLTALLAAVALGVSVTAAYAAPLIVTPNQFQFQTWGGNISFSTAGAYSGDGAFGYGYTMNYGNSPSATVIIPLGNNLAPGWHLYTIAEWDPVATSQYHVMNIINEGIGYGVSSVPGEPWAGQFGTQQQYLSVPGGPVGAFDPLGPGPQSDSSLGGSEVWIDGSTPNPYLEIHYLGFENTEETFDAVTVTAVSTPEHSALAFEIIPVIALGIAFRKRLSIRPSL